MTPDERLAKAVGAYLYAKDAGKRGEAYGNMQRYHAALTCEHRWVSPSVQGYARFCGNCFLREDE